MFGKALAGLIFVFVLTFTPNVNARAGRYKRAFDLTNSKCGPVFPATIANGKRGTCRETNALFIECIYNCNPGYLKQGSSTDTTISLMCDPDDDDPQIYLDPSMKCIPHCENGCLNGGNCTAPNHCDCVPPYFGPACSNVRNKCLAPKDPQFGSWICDNTADGGKQCKATCFGNFEFKTPPAAIYTCSPDGHWSPSPDGIPGCQAPVDPVTTPRPTIKTVKAADSLCAIWGIHIRTFDTRIIPFNGNCRYVMARFPDGTEVTVTKKKMYRVIEIYQDGSHIVLSQDGSGKPVVEWDDQPLTIPGFRAGSLVEKVGRYVVFRSSHGFILKWNGAYSAYLTVSEPMKSKLKGLCGDYDGNKDNDLRTPAGSVVTDPNLFGESWKKSLSGDAFCVSGTQVQTCTATQESVVKPKCEVMKTDPAFTACNSKLDPSPYIESCQTDCCITGANQAECACKAFEEYSKACTDKQIELKWRQPGRCEASCSGGQIYKECGSACERDCTNANEVCDDKTCVDGCFCPDGQVLHNGNCVDVDSCPCTANGKEYNNGEKIKKFCNTCQCKAGEWLCTKANCDKICAATGDPHYQTIDGKRFNFMGNCSYYMIKGDDFSIVTDNIKCGTDMKASCTKSMSIDIYGLTIKMDHHHQLFINNREIKHLPYVLPGLTISMVSSIFMQAKLDNGIKVLWDGSTRAYIKVPPTFVNKTKGMCGTYDGNTKNDFITPRGTLEPTPNLFGNSWKTITSCTNMPGVNETHPCDKNKAQKPQAIALCQKLRSSVFDACHALDPTMKELNASYDDCLYDVCACTSNINECFCSVAGTYATNCAAKGAKTNWRNSISECAPKCPSGQVYDVCVRPCEMSCRAIATNTDDTCDTDCNEGCRCPTGQTLDDSNRCVPISACPCIMNGKVYPPGFTTYIPNKLCQCNNARFTCTKIKIIDDNIKPLCDKTSEVYKKCVNNCPATCSEPSDPSSCAIKECKPGCECAPGYVLQDKKCIKASTCPCFYAGKAYNEGEKYYKECNECTCHSQSWNCTQKLCPSICRAYGESHYRTFDGKEYQFQGACDYILVQSTTANNSTFTITTKNAECGTSGVTCFKKLVFTIGKPNSPEFYTLELVKGKPVAPETGSPFVVKEIGEMVYIYTPFGVELQWDKGTRVYVRLSTYHRSKVEGLCGNFNKDITDDLTPRHGTGAAVKATLFGDSWKLHETCTNSTKVTETCSSSLRKDWAKNQCSILTSDLFATCQATVDVKPYFDRCVYDACGCDIGGDCECVCTAIAAYAHECASNGINIFWRSKEICPMQCANCYTYNPCMTLCPKKTCDNRLVYTDKMDECQLGKGLCFEGCDLKPCPKGQVYDSLKEPVSCIPESMCETAYCEYFGKKYRDGERIEDGRVCNNECEICYCRNGNLEHITSDSDCVPLEGTPTPSDLKTPSAGYKTPKPDLTPHLARRTSEKIDFTPSGFTVKTEGA